MIYITITLISFAVFLYLIHNIKQHTPHKSWIIWVMAVPLLSVGVYFYVGNPEYHDQPYAKLKQQEQALLQKSPDDLIAELKQKLTQQDSARGRYILALALLRMGKTDDAVLELERAYRLSDEKTPEIIMTYAMILTVKNNNIVGDKSWDLIKKTLKTDASNIYALYYAGLYECQHKNFDKSAEYWKNIVDNHSDEPQYQETIKNIKQSADICGLNLKKYHITVPDIKSNYTPQQIQMIERMVEQLRQKVKNNPDNMELKKRLDDVEEKFKSIKESVKDFENFKI